MCELSIKYEKVDCERIVFAYPSSMEEGPNHRNFYGKYLSTLVSLISEQALISEQGENSMKF